MKATKPAGSQTRRYLVLPRDKRYEREVEAWCVKNAQPWVIGWTRRKYASLEMDLIFARHRLSDEAIAQVQAILTHESDDGIRMHAGETISHCAKVEASRVDRILKSLLLIYDMDKARSERAVATDAPR